MGQLVMRERAREARPDVMLPLEVNRADDATDEWDATFERRIRDVASRAVAHLKRGDVVTVRTSSGERARADKSIGADPILRYLALLQPNRGATTAPTAANRTPRPDARPTPPTPLTAAPTPAATPKSASPTDDERAAE